MGALRNWLYNGDEFVERPRVGGYPDWLGDVFNKIKEHPQYAMMGASMLGGSSAGDFLKLAAGAYVGYKLYNKFQDMREEKAEKQLIAQQNAQFGIKKDRSESVMKIEERIRQVVGPKREPGVAYDGTDVGVATAALMLETKKAKLSEMPQYVQMRAAKRENAEHLTNWLQHFEASADGLQNIRFIDQNGKDVTGDLLDNRPTLDEAGAVKQNALNTMGLDAIVYGLDHGALRMETTNGEPILNMSDRFNKNESAMISYEDSQRRATLFEAEWNQKVLDTVQNLPPQQIARYAPKSCPVSELNNFVDSVKSYSAFETEMTKVRAESYRVFDESLGLHYLASVSDMAVAENIIDADVTVEGENVKEQTADVIDGEYRVVDAEAKPQETALTEAPKPVNDAVRQVMNAAENISDRETGMEVEAAV